MDGELKRVLLTKFLQWNDRNGFYTDENCDLEDIPRLTYEEAQKYSFVVINKEFYDEIIEDITELDYDEVIKYAKVNNFYDKTLEKLDLLYNSEDITYELYRVLID